MNDSATPANGMRLTTAFYPPVENSEHIIEKDDITGGTTEGTTEGKKVITTQGGVLLGKMSFKMLTNESLNMNAFELVPGTTSPRTGIKINLDATHCYEKSDPKTGVFRFTNEVASKDADLSNLVLSSGKVNEENPDESTYKEYNLTPSFEKETKNYTLTLLEHLDIIDITATQSNEFATMKIKTPKRDEKGNLMYEEDGTTIIYEEKELVNEEKTGVTLNKLGEPDTIITIHVTAENTSIENEYQIIIKRPYGIIKGSIYTDPTASKGTYKANIRIYKSSLVSTKIDWSTLGTVENGDNVHEELLKLESQEYKTNDDGTYEIYVAPGKYDILLDKPAYLDCIYIEQQIEEGEEYDLGNKVLTPGDLDKNGIINGSDLSTMKNIYGMYTTDENINADYDFNEDTAIDGGEVSYVKTNYLKTREIIE